MNCHPPSQFFDDPPDDDVMPPADLVKIFKSTMPRCKDMLIRCTWAGYAEPCLSLFKVMTTDDGFCCIFNAFDSYQVLKEEFA